jgi:LPXTG-motif cell wall-anchored protein
MRVLTIISMLLVLGFPGKSEAQVEAHVKLDTNTLLIGDQTQLELTFSAPSNYEVLWPQIRDTIIRQVEILKHSDLQISLSDDQSVRSYRQTFTITSFDSGYYAIPPIIIPYMTREDTTKQFAETEAMLLEVRTVPVNLEKDIKDIKDPLRAPFTLREALPYILIILGAAVLGFLLYYYLKKRKKAEPVFQVPVARNVPPHQAALEALEELRYKKLWQQGHVKQYHTEITEILREYLFGQFGIHAQEYTSGEIMAAVNGTPVNQQAKEKLQQTLSLADMVKFAKMQPLPVEHDASLNHAIDFVRESTHLTTTNAEIPTASDEDQPEERKEGEDV